VGSAPAFFGKGLTDEQAIELMDAAWELGITHFDTADAYGGGRSERAIGRWMRARGARPTITTKTFNPMHEGGDRGLAPARIERSIRGSLERLGVGSVDIYLAHDFDPHVPLADTLGAFDRLAASGAIVAYGVSNFGAAQLEEALGAGSPQAVQNSHSLLDRADERQVLPMCAEREVAFMAFSPLAGGWLTGKYRRGDPFPPGSRMTQRPEPYEHLCHEPTFDALDGLARLAAQRGSSMAAVALAWLLADERVTQVVVGPGRPDHLEPVREALERPLSAQECAHLEECFDR
jgi:aryl-alcohol dehydrogenase-like predicted oxidoreductase